MKETLALIPPGGSALLWMTVITVLAILPALFIAWITVSSATSSVEISNSQISVPGMFGKKTFDLSELHLERARVVDAREDGYRRVLRTRGMGLPGFQLGWFRLQNGESAYAYITGSQRLVYVPMGNNESLMLSFEDPDRAVTALRAAG